MKKETTKTKQETSETPSGGAGLSAANCTPYRVVFHPNVDEAHDCLHIETAETEVDSVRILDAIARYTLTIHECSFMKDFSNTGYIEKWTDDVWEEFEANT